MLIDEIMPSYDFVERHSISVAGTPEVAWDALVGADIGESGVVRSLMALRAIPAAFVARRQGKPISIRRRLTVRSLQDAGFTFLGETPHREMTYGLIGKFWRPDGGCIETSPDSFRRPIPDGYAAAVWNFSIARRGAAHSEISTETRIRCADAGAKRAFRLYWLAVRPFSGMLRREMLKSIRRYGAGITASRISPLR